MKKFSSRAISLGTLGISVIMGSAGMSGCSLMSDNSNGLPKIGARYEAPATKTRVHEVDLAEVGKLNLKLASAYYSAGQYQTASESASIAVEALPSDVSALGMAALIQVELHNSAKAQSYFDRAFKIAPKDADLNHNYGLYLCRADGKNNPSLGIEHFKIALAVEGYMRSSSSLSAGGDCLAKLGRDEEAIQFYTAALRFEPANRFALLGLADLQYRRGALREALEMSSRYARVAVASPDSLWLQIRIARKLGMAQDEKGYAADLRRTFPGAAQTNLLEDGKFD